MYKLLIVRGFDTTLSKSEIRTFPIKKSEKLSFSIIIIFLDLFWMHLVTQQWFLIYN